MKGTLTKEEVLSALGVQCFENVTADKMANFIKKARNMTPEDQDAALRQLCDFGKLAHGALEHYREVGKKVLEGNAESMKRVNDQYASMQSFLETWAKGEAEFEKRKYIYEEMKKLADRVEKKDSENKGFLTKLLSGVVAIVTILATAVVAKGKMKQEHTDENSKAFDSWDVDESVDFDRSSFRSSRIEDE